MSAWLFDLGNTRLKCAPLLDDGSVGGVVALPHRDADFANALASVLPPRFDTAYLANVAAPPLMAALMAQLGRHVRRISVARTQRRFAGISIAYAQPERLGVDRFLTLLAAHADARGPVLVCGVGTALTLDLIDANGRHIGGRIAPSPTLMRESLHGRAPQLPATGGEYRAFAADTPDALVSGCDGAAVALVERSLELARQQLGEAPALRLHGGGGEALLPHLPAAQWSPALVLQGLGVWAAAERP